MTKRVNITDQTLFNMAGTHYKDYKLELKLYSLNQLLKLKKLVQENLFNDPYGKKVSYIDYDKTKIMNLIEQELRHRKLNLLLEADKKKTQRNKKDYTKHKNLYIKELELIKESYITIFKRKMTITEYIDFLDQQGLIQRLIDNTELDKVKETIHNFILEKTFNQSK